MTLYWLFGALGGDIIGSVYEHNNHKSKDFPLFAEGSDFTDDSVMTIAAADAILVSATNSTTPDYTAAYQLWGRDYPGRGYGAWFLNWLYSDDPQPYNSCGNGSAMRVSPVGFVFDTWEKVMSEAQASAECTHNDSEGIKGAQATAGAILLARTGSSKEEIKQRIENEFDYDLSKTLDEIRPSYEWEEEIWLCQGTVPQALVSFLESDSYEDTIRNSISLGGDSDTLAAIAGSIAIAYYKEMPEDIFGEISSRLDSRLLDICERFQKHCS